MRVKLQYESTQLGTTINTRKMTISLTEKRIAMLDEFSHWHNDPRDPNMASWFWKCVVWSESVTIHYWLDLHGQYTTIIERLVEDFIHVNVKKSLVIMLGSKACLLRESLLPGGWWVSFWNLVAYLLNVFVFNKLHL